MLESGQLPLSVDFVCFDVRDVTSITLTDSDSAYRHLMWKKVLRLADAIESTDVRFVRIVDKNAPIYEAIQRRSRITATERPAGWEMFRPKLGGLLLTEFDNVEEALEYLMLDSLAYEK